MSPSLPTSLLADLQRLSKCARCSRDRAPDSDHCAECDTKLKGYKRTYAAKRRAARKQQGLCKDCGKRSKLRRCRQCERKQSRVEHSSKRVDQARPIPPTPRGFYKSEPGADGVRTRYVGQSHRGGPTRVEQRAARVRLLVDAQRLFDRFREYVAQEHPELDALPRIQRVEERARLAVDGTRAARLLLEAAAEEGCSVAPLWMQALAGEDE